MTVSSFHTELATITASGSMLHSLPELADLAVGSLLAPAVEETSELIFGRVTLKRGQSLPLHEHSHSETIFLLDGSARVRRGSGSAELAPQGAAYFPAGTPHTVEALNEPVSFLVAYPRGDISRQVETTLTDTADDLPNPNIITGENLMYRWALIPDFEQWGPVEPTKGWGLKLRYLFDPRRGSPDLVVGMGHQEPNMHYTLHHHEPAEIYYVLGGAGVIYVGDDAYEVSCGSTVYVPAEVVHGIDTFDAHLDLYWLYNLDRCGADWNWKAVEPIYNTPRR